MSRPTTPDPTRPLTTAAAPLASPFGAAPDGGRPRRRRLARRLVAGGAAAAVLLAGGAAVAGTGGSSSAGFRTATVGTHTVDQVLHAVATIEPVTQASVAFPVAGTVSTVPVKVGSNVAMGQVLATLDTGALEDARREDQAALDRAELVLEKALAGEDVSSLAGGGGGGGGTTPTTGAATRNVAYVTTDAALTTGPAATTAVAYAAAKQTPADDGLRAAQQAVLDAQKQVDLDLNAAQTALDSATQVCAAVGQSTDAGNADADGSTTTTAAGAATTTTTIPTTTTSPTTGDHDVTGCRDALAAVLAAQHLVATDQAKLAHASTALTDLLEQRTAAGTGSPPSTTTPSGGRTGPSNANPSGSAGTGTGSGSPPSGTDRAAGTTPPTGSGSGATSSPSAAQLVAYQKAVDAAAAQVTVAEQAIAQATIVSPVQGTVAAVNLAAGGKVSAGSSTATIIVVGAGGYEVTTNVSVDDLPDVEVGQAATVRPDASKSRIKGEVVAIGVAGTTSGSTTSYPVTIGITGDSSGLANGATASVAIVTDAADAVLAVPTSAVTVNGDRHTVTVVDGRATKTTTVKVGAVGDTWTEITSRLRAGQEVALADLDKALPGSATASKEQTDQTGPGGRVFGPGGTGGPPAGAFPGGPRPGN